ncbi:MAG: small ribosomal subunit Rsm22 family protein [Nitrospirota bacterium]|nr:small ribosomal subunit Rsm22 family protein [Nitrospirota bacterium]
MKQGQKPSSPDIKALAEAVQRLSHLLTRERERLPDAYLNDHELRQAYLQYFLPVNRAKIIVPLQELSLHPAGLLSGCMLRVLDIGSGPGTSILGILDFFEKRGTPPILEFTAVDAVPGNLSEAERLFRAAAAGYGSKASIKTMVRSFGEGSGRVEGTFDLIVLSNVLNELFHDKPDRNQRRAGVLADLLKTSLAATGSCIIIEPSLRETSRDLLSLRDALVIAGFTIYSPCLTQEPCPALVNPRDWCHEDRPWEAPQLIREIDSLIGLRKDSLKFSYLVVRRDTRAVGGPFPEGAFRVVSEPLVTKGKRELFLCGTGGRRQVMRQDKDASPENAAFTELLRGDVVRFKGLVDEVKRLRVTKETVVIL